MSQGCRRRQQHERIRGTSHVRVAKLTGITNTGVTSKVQGKTRTRNKREMLPLGVGNTWGRNLDLPQYEMRAYLQDALCGTRAGFEGSLSAIEIVAWGFRNECAISFRLLFNIFVLYT